MTFPVDASRVSAQTDIAADVAAVDATRAASQDLMTATVNAGFAPVYETFVGGINFTAGTTSALTTSMAYGSINNITVHFDSVFQGPDQITSVVGHVVTFTSPIPVGVSNVYIKGGTVQSVGIPSAQSVGVPQLGTDALSYFVKTAGISPHHPARG